MKKKDISQLECVCSSVAQSTSPKNMLILCEFSFCYWKTTVIHILLYIHMLLCKLRETLGCGPYQILELAV